MATAVAAILARARREVDDLFFENDAFSPERAVAFEPRMSAQKRYLDQLMAQGTVHESEPGRYWLDLPVYREQRRVQFVWTMWVLGLAAVVVLVVWAVKSLTH
jgi:hypothetical protein